jgi:DNA-binding helix-hairpin-helix protein with protein kinase domain
MNLPQVLAGGKPLQLERMIGKGGEGEVFVLTADAVHAVKIYTDKDRLSREGKITAMVRSDLAKRSPLAAFPVAVVHHRDGSFAGFMMKLVGGHRPLHELYAPGSRKHHFPQADYRFLARSASNIARAFASVHQAGCVVGDINHSGILVSNKATVALIDADSFQFTDGTDQYLCRVGVPEYTPPELQGKSLQGIVRTPDHDAFGLAVVIFQVLLMGRHPFVGTVRRGDIPPIHENIENFRYVYAENRDVGMDQPPGTPALSDFSPELAKLFDRAFSRASIGQRPLAPEWLAALERFEGSLIQCADNALHYGPRDASECAWCEMERQLSTFLFLPYVPAGPLGTPAVDPGMAAFHLEAIWVRIERVVVPTAEQLRPKLPQVSSSPSDAATGAKASKGRSSVALGLVLLLAAVGILVVVPKAWILAAGLAFWGFKCMKEDATPSIDGTRFRNEYVEAQHQWYRELDGWRKRVGFEDLEGFKEQLKGARHRYAELDAAERQQIEGYRAHRRQRQLQSYLEGFDLSRADIKGIGQAKLATLSSYGVDTAADLTKARLATLPGFGEALIGRLLEWRQKHEGRFVYNASENDADRQEIARLRAITQGKAGPLRATLTNGASDLEMRARRVHEFALKVDPVLAKVHERLGQARADLTFLGLSPPSVSPPPRRAGAATSFGSTSTNARHPAAPPPPYGVPSPPASAPGRGTAPTCPRCSSQMKQRLARRGRNAGSYFWGCARYPSCKGTRPI